MSKSDATLAKVIAGSNLVAVRMVEVQAHLKSLEVRDYEYNLEIKGKAPQIVEKDGKRLLLAICAVSLSPKAAGAMVPVEIMVGMEAVYELADASITQKDCESFVRQNVPYNLWPYFRETIQSVTARMQVNPPVVLPLMKPSLAIAGETK